MQALRAQLNPEDPDTRELRGRQFKARELAREVRKEAMANTQDGLLFGVCRVAARALSPVLCREWGLEDPEHEAAMEEYLIARQLRTLREEVNPIDYRDYRVESLQRASGSGS